jgi:hypothetical protein
MKKTFLLLFSIGTLTTVFAQDGRYQNGRNESREVILGHDDQHSVYDNTWSNRNNSYDYDHGRREEIDRISNDYDRRIEAIERDRHMRNRDKQREISRLQHEKEQAIRDINARYERQAPHYDARPNGRY